jgi:hypothetical protein
MPAYYTLSLLTKGLWIQCTTCKVHARPYVEGLDLPWKPSKTYVKQLFETSLRAEELKNPPLNSHQKGIDMSTT